ncbi:hypothetical protein L218DRAFT_950984 [Marasmius fiardii PR-910]|nr:hypothetical protein L218DRAFT_950984 [Marasmius fiardii PR-910]
MSSSSSHPSAVANNHTQNEMLNHASGVTINGSSFSNIGRDQYHHCTLQQTFIHAPQNKDLNIRMDPPELDQFTEVKRGDIYKDSSGVCYSWRLWSNGKDDTKAAVYHAELNIVGPFAQKKFTVKTYRGQNAMKEWRRDFLSCSADWCRSSIPLLIFCEELIPVAHIRFDAGVPEVLVEEYLNALRITLNCSVNEIWMDPVKGKFCRGPAGPEFMIFPIFSDFTPPADMEFLKEGVLVHYLASIKEDRQLLSMLSINYPSKPAKTFQSNHPQVISSLHNSIIAWHDVEWKEYEGFNEREVTCGLTRPFSIWCKYLGLPFKLSLQVFYQQCTWPTEVYKILHDYQIARGFDPQTTDFARFMGYQPWEVVPLETRFQELDKGSFSFFDSDDDSYSPNILFDGNQGKVLTKGSFSFFDSDDDPYSLDILFDGNQGLSEFTPNSQSPHSLNTVLIGKSLGTCQVMKPVPFPSMLAPHYARMLASADQLSNSEQLLDVD